MQVRELLFHMVDLMWKAGAYSLANYAPGILHALDLMELNQTSSWKWTVACSAVLSTHSSQCVFPDRKHACMPVINLVFEVMPAKLQVHEQAVCICSPVLNSAQIMENASNSLLNHGCWKHVAVCSCMQPCGRLLHPISKHKG